MIYVYKYKELIITLLLIVVGLLLYNSFSNNSTIENNNRLNEISIKRIDSINSIIDNKDTDIRVLTKELKLLRKLDSVSIIYIKERSPKINKLKLNIGTNEGDIPKKVIDSLIIKIKSYERTNLYINDPTKPINP